MKKKHVALLALLLFVPLLCFAANPAAPSRHIPIQGVVGKIHSVSVSPIVATSAADLRGMPFNIMGSDVASTQASDRGREIATWSLLTNYYPTTLTVTVEPMQGVTSQWTLDYELYIKYLYHCTSSTGAPLVTDGAMIIATNGTTPNTKSITLNRPNGASDESFISINDSPIRFRFIDDSELKVAPDDEYRATITFTVIGE